MKECVWIVEYRFGDVKRWNFNGAFSSRKAARESIKDSKIWGDDENYRIVKYYRGEVLR